LNDNFSSLGIAPADIYLPRPGTDLTRWAVVACDQYTSQPDYWNAAEQLVGPAPSALRITLPEIYLNEATQRVPLINRTMADYLSQGILQKQVAQGFILTQRITSAGERLGLMVAADLEAYDYHVGSQSLIRATEGTIADRLPPRVAIRKDALLETPHVMCLLDDPVQTVIEPLFEKHSSMPPIYDFPLMLGGGHLRGWAITSPEDLMAIAQALTKLKQTAPFLYAVGDGNHSLATAKTCWEQLKPSLSPEEQLNHPARYALVELENIHCPALVFEPIHRLLTGVSFNELLADWAAYCEEHGMALSSSGSGHTIQLLCGDKKQDVTILNPEGALPVGTLQAYLDNYLLRHPEAGIDYIHGLDALKDLSAQPGSIGFAVPTLDKSALFPAVHAGGALPRKTFSMGEAHEKRYYMECRMIR